MRRGTPNSSITSIARGSAASELAVEKAMSAGSFTTLMNRLSGTLARSATGMSTKSTNTASAP